MDDIDLTLLHAIVMDKMKNDMPGLIKMLDPEKVGGEKKLREIEATLKSFMLLKSEEPTDG